MCKLTLTETDTWGVFQDQEGQYRFVGSTIPLPTLPHAENFGNLKLLREANTTLELGQLEQELRQELRETESLLVHPVLGGATHA